MENLLNFNLQLFTEGVEANAEAPVEVAEVTTDVPAGDPTPAESNSSSDFDFALDENGNLVFGEDIETVEDPIPVTEAPVEEVAPMVQAPSYYTSADIESLGIYNLDVSKVSPEMMPLYRQVIASKSEMQSQIDALNKPPVVEEVAPAQTQRQYYEQVYNIAKGKVEANLEETFDEFNPLHLTALSDEVATIKNYVIQTQNQQNEVTNLVGQYTVDPEWNSIQTYAKNALDNMPYHQSKAIREKLDAGDVGFLGQFLSTAKEEYYKAKNPKPVVPVKPLLNIPTKPVVKPPMVENAGTGTNTPAQQNFNYKSMGKMTNDQLADTFSKLGLTNI